MSKIQQIELIVIITRKYPNKQKDYYEIEPEEIEEEEEYKASSTFILF